MALVEQGGRSQREKSGKPSKGLQCHTCKEYKNQLFTTDAYNRPMCADCAEKSGRPIQ